MCSRCEYRVIEFGRFSYYYASTHHTGSLRVPRRVRQGTRLGQARGQASDLCPRVGGCARLRRRESQTLASFRCSYNSTADETLSPGGFYHLLIPTLAEYPRDLVERGLDQVAIPDAFDADIDRLRD